VLRFLFRLRLPRGCAAIGPRGRRPVRRGAALGRAALAHRRAADAARGRRMRSALYTGMVLHERMRPRRHKLAYRVFSLLLDLDELPALRGRFGLLGIEAPGLLSFRSADHG